MFNDTKEKVSEMVVQLRFKDLLKDLYRDNELTEKEKEFAITEAKRWGMSEAEARHIIGNVEWDHNHKKDPIVTLENGTKMPKSKVPINTIYINEKGQKCRKVLKTQASTSSTKTESKNNTPAVSAPIKPEPPKRT